MLKSIISIIFSFVFNVAIFGSALANNKVVDLNSIQEFWLKNMLSYSISVVAEGPNTERASAIITMKDFVDHEFEPKHDVRTNIRNVYLKYGFTEMVFFKNSVEELGFGSDILSEGDLYRVGCAISEEIKEKVKIDCLARSVK